jgi:4-carboxymuconolactone decarboxylase
MMASRPPMRAPWRDIAPHLTDISNIILFDDVWQRPELSPRDRSLVTISALIALYRGNELPFHLAKALENGVTREEIVEAITHLAFYSGWPTASSALTVARQVFADADNHTTHSQEAENADA